MASTETKPSRTPARRNGRAPRPPAQARSLTAALPVNQPPVMDPISSKDAHPDRQLAFLITANDPDGGPLTFSLINNPPVGAAVDGQGNFTWTPTWAQLGSYTLSARVTDPGGLTDTKYFTVTVGNQAPTLDPLPALPTAHPGRAITFTATASDPDNDPLVFSLVNPPAGATMDAAGNFNWTPTWAQLGSHTITVKVTDPGGASNTRSVTVTVANQPPVLDPLPTVPPGHPGKLMAFTATASDPDNDPFTFALASGPAGAAMDGNGNFTWTPTWAQVGSHTVAVRVTDQGGMSDTRSLTVTVSNQAPVINPIPTQSGKVGQAVSFTATATDPDNDPVTFALASGPAGSSISPQGQFSWTPSMPGSYTISIRATDPGGMSGYVQVTVNVSP